MMSPQPTHADVGGSRLAKRRQQRGNNMPNQGADDRIVLNRTASRVAHRSWLLGLGLAALLLPASAVAQAPERTIDEIKAEAQARAERRNYPLIGLDPADVRDALAGIKTRDADEWAANWGAVADRYIAKAEAASSAEDKRANYLRAWRLYYF